MAISLRYTAAAFGLEFNPPVTVGLHSRGPVGLLHRYLGNVMPTRRINYLASRQFFEHYRCPVISNRTAETVLWKLDKGLLWPVDDKFMEDV